MTLKPFPRPHLIPKPKRLPKRKRMTVAVGFLCTRGVVIAADTQESSGDIKAYVQKLEVRRFQHCRAAIAGSGVGPLIDHAARDIFSILATTTDATDVAVAISETMLRLYKREFKHYPLPARNKDIQMLVAFKIAKEPPRMLFIDSTLVNPVDKAKAIGFGEFLNEDVQEIASMITALNLSVEPTMWAALRLVHEAKKRYTTVGGTKTAIAGLCDDGRMLRDPEADQADREQVFDCLRRAGHIHLLSVAPTLSDDTNRSMMSLAENMILRAREKLVAIRQSQIAFNAAEAAEAKQP